MYGSPDLVLACQREGHPSAHRRSDRLKFEAAAFSARAIKRETGISRRGSSHHVPSLPFTTSRPGPLTPTTPPSPSKASIPSPGRAIRSAAPRELGGALSASRSACLRCGDTNEIGLRMAQCPPETSRNRHRSGASVRDGRGAGFSTASMCTKVPP